MSSSTISVTTTQTQTRLNLPKTPTASRSLRRPTASTPNLNLVYSAQSNSRLAPPVGLSRKTSFAALTTTSLASIPDVSESYAYDSVPLLTTDRPSSRISFGIPDINMAPATPRRPTSDDLSVGDQVDVPGSMHGTVRFVGSVQGKKGLFAGVELHSDYAAKGKNSGEVDGVSYFETMIPGAGIFVPVAKAFRRGSPIPSLPMTPSTSGLRSGYHNSSGWTPPTPGLPKFSASVGPGARAPSPGGKRQPRNSLPRPESPVRRTQMTPGPRPSMGAAGKTPSRFGSPTNRFAQSVRGTAGDPNKRLGADRKLSLGPRSHSALGSADMFDDDATPVPRSKTNGSVGSVSSFSNKVRPLSRANCRNDEEVERLRNQLEDRERQLKDQSATLVEMETSLTELQSLMENAEGLGGPPARNSTDDKDSSQLRHLLREKNEKIAMLTAEFDAHRADFRSTIDALEMASTETERVYEKRIEELMGDVRDLESRNMDVDSVATQLRQLEELVQELEEGLEDARRGEAEARGEVEFLRGEVERTRTQLRGARELAVNSHSGSGGGDNSHSSKELEQKEDEIRGLKAIIHSLSRDSVPNDDRTPISPIQRRTSTPHRPGSWIPNDMAKDIVDVKIARDNLERQVAELQSILEQKNNREDELEQELDNLRGVNANTHRSSLRDSRDTVVLSRAHEARSPDGLHKRGGALDTMAESDAQSDATANSTLWCEICETSGHDILTCTNMFGPDGAKNNGNVDLSSSMNNSLRPHGGDDMPAPLSPARSKSPMATPTVKTLPNPMESGPVAGKESGIMDPEKWCAVCERDGHDSVDCPFEYAF